MPHTDVSRCGKGVPQNYVKTMSHFLETCKDIYMFYHLPWPGGDMSQIELENNFTQVPNELLEQICRCSLNGSTMRVLLAIYRKTYGWHKDAGLISIGQLQKLTGLSQRTVIYALQNLEAKKVIVIKRETTFANVISLQIDCELWLPSAQLCRSKSDNKVNPLLHNCADDLLHNPVKTSAQLCSKLLHNCAEETGDNAAPIRGLQTPKENKKKKKKVKYSDLPTKPFSENPESPRQEEPEKEIIKEKEEKMSFGDDVTLTEKEYEKLKTKYGEADTTRIIEILDNYKGANGKKYKSDYKAILNWVIERYRKEKKNAKQEVTIPQRNIDRKGRVFI
jgi:phage replication O-like protein O